MMFNVSIYAPRDLGSNHTDSMTDLIDASDLGAYLGNLGLNWKQSDQWHDGRVIIIIEPASPEAEAQVAELQDKLDKIGVVLES